MRRTFSVVAAGGILLLGVVFVLLWGGVDRRPADVLERQTTYDTPAASTEQDTFTVVTYNLGALAKSSLGRAAALLQEVQPDFVALQEMRFTKRSSDGEVLLLDSLARQLRAAASAEAARRDDRLSTMWSRIGGHSTAFGQALLSRFPIRRHTRRLIDRDSSSLWGRFLQPQPVVQVAVAGIGGWPLVLMNVNLDATAPTARRRQARAVNRLYQRISQQGFPVLVLGSIGPSRSADASPSSDDETRRLLLRGTDLQPAIFSEGALVSGRSVATHPAPDPDRKLDYVFYSPGLIAPIDAQIRCGAPPPSDHCAISFSFLLPRPVDRLPDTRIPDEELPSLDRYLDPQSVS
jgi:endonuclease/exonuclease/phosphatase family metal-dependent hydrolase